VYEKIIDTSADIEVINKIYRSLLNIIDEKNEDSGNSR